MWGDSELTLKPILWAYVCSCPEITCSMVLFCYMGIDKGVCNCNRGRWWGHHIGELTSKCVAINRKTAITCIKPLSNFPTLVICFTICETLQSKDSCLSQTTDHTRNLLNVTNRLHVHYWACARGGGREGEGLVSRLLLQFCPWKKSRTWKNGDGFQVIQLWHSTVAE